jgi:hypothetical protein
VNAMMRSVLISVIFNFTLGAIPAFAQIDCGTFCMSYCAKREPGAGYDNGNCQIGCNHGCYWYLAEHQGQLQKPAAAKRRKPAASYR